MISKHFTPYIGGLEARVIELAKWLTTKKENIVVLTSRENNTKTKEEIAGVKVLRSKTLFTVFNAPITPGIFWDLMREEYDLIDVNLPDPTNSILALAASMIRQKPIIITYHADILKEGTTLQLFKTFYDPLLNILLKRAKKILVTSPNYAKQSTTLKPHLAKTEVTPSFVDLNRFNPSRKDANLTKSLAPSGEKIILFVGRLVPYKGVNILLESFQKIRDASHTMLVIVGGGSEKKQLMQQAELLGLKDSVKFTSDVPDKELPLYFGSCDLLVLPSITRQEAYGLVLVEAMASAKPVITTNFSGMPYVLGDEKLEKIGENMMEAQAGILVPPNDSYTLAKAMMKILTDEEYAKKIGAKGLERARKMFSTDTVCARVSSAYKSCI